VRLVVQMSPSRPTIPWPRSFTHSS
jgi:hypothetical protein